MLEIKKTANGYEFNRIDEDGQEWSLGGASERVQFEGTEDEYRWFDGHFDTKEIAFEDEDELVKIISRRKPNDEVVWA